jgi:hypothetical protein
MNYRVLWLRIAYWAGAFLDAKACVWMLSAKPILEMNDGRQFHPGWDYRYAMAFGAALMAGWTVLLLWADRKPVERRGVLLITVFPVIAGLNAARYYLYLGGFVAVPFTVTGIIVPVAVTVLFLFAYFYSFVREQKTTA